jgi:crotonobetainyl-CoA:carnitine CoA-transferase CaiB-like acyl-CoA transferase
MGSVDYPSFPFSLNGEPVGNSRPAPCLGEHNEQVLGELLGLADEELAQLREQKVIGDRPVFM